MRCVNEKQVTHNNHAIYERTRTVWKLLSIAARKLQTQSHKDIQARKSGQPKSLDIILEIVQQSGSKKMNIKRKSPACNEAQQCVGEQQNLYYTQGQHTVTHSSVGGGNQNIALQKTCKYWSAIMWEQGNKWCIWKKWASRDTKPIFLNGKLVLMKYR